MIKKAFTLVELVVIVTILIILSTIWLISYMWYSSDARDSLRLTDLVNIKKAIDINKINTWKLPQITNPVEIKVWTEIIFRQWTFWNATISDLKWLINKNPKDPLTKLEYSYSVTSDGKEYEIWGFLENDKFTLSTFPQANAWESITTAFIRWNYNGQFVKVISWNNVLALASPSITTNNQTVLDLEEISNQNLFVYDGFYNLPANFVDSKYSVYWSVKNRFLNTSNIEIFNWNISDLNQDINQLKFIENLQKAYKDTDLSNKSIINNLLNKDLNSSETLKDAKIMLNTLISDKISIK